MKLISFIILFFTVSFFKQDPVLITSYPPHLQKKIDKILNKTFKGEKVHSISLEYNPGMINLDVLSVVNDRGKPLGIAIIQLNNGCKLGGCMEIESYNPEETYETFYCITVYNTNSTIINIRVLEYGGKYGYEITARSWLNQFIGAKEGNFRLGHEIDAISGATISANAMVRMMNDQQKFIDSISQKLNASIPN